MYIYVYIPFKGTQYIPFKGTHDSKLRLEPCRTQRSRVEAALNGGEIDGIDLDYEMTPDLESGKGAWSPWFPSKGIYRVPFEYNIGFL